MGRFLKAVAVVAPTFVVVCGGSWVVCFYLGYPHDPEHRWEFCVGLGAVVAAVVQGSLNVTAAKRSRSTVVKGDDNRVVGAGAHHNALGDRSAVKASQQGSGAPSPGPDTDQEMDGATVLRGKGNRAAGADAHDNALGDDSRVE